MRITDELNLTPWMPLRAEDPAAAARRLRLEAAQAAAPVAALNALDTDRDGWLDEDDLPYDQLRLLERARASGPVEEPSAEPAPPPPGAAAAAPVEVPAPPPEPPKASPAGVAPHIDLLA
jgi:hypothetical protein